MTETIELDADRLLLLSNELVDRGGSAPVGPHLSLLCRVGHDLLCALPLEHIGETMRPLAVVPMAGVPSFIQGLSVVRGIPVPVVNVALLLGGEASDATRFVTVKTGTRRIVLAVDAVVGVIEMSPGSVEAFPELLQNGELDAIAAIGVLDAALLLVLRSSRLVPAEVWATIQAGGAAA